MLLDKQRVKQCFRQSPEDALGSWYGGLCGPVSDDLAVVGYDDGELITQQINELRGVFEMGKFKTHSMTGLVHKAQSAHFHLRARADSDEAWRCLSPSRCSTEGSIQILRGEPVL